ncbi:MAG: hypothetical protein IKE16_09705, partial [Solobacterium sp.]|nr:hypothetical protein [Solobacterium sp.]
YHYASETPPEKTDFSCRKNFFFRISESEASQSLFGTFLIIFRTKNGYLGFKISMNLSSAV